MGTLEEAARPTARSGCGACPSRWTGTSSSASSRPPAQVRYACGGGCVGGGGCARAGLALPTTGRTPVGRAISRLSFLLRVRPIRAVTFASIMQDKERNKSRVSHLELLPFRRPRACFAAPNRSVHQSPVMRKRRAAAWCSLRRRIRRSGPSRCSTGSRCVPTERAPCSLSPAPRCGHGVLLRARVLPTTTLLAELLGAAAVVCAAGGWCRVCREQRPAHPSPTSVCAVCVPSRACRALFVVIRLVAGLWACVSMRVPVGVGVGVGVGVVPGRRVARVSRRPSRPTSASTRVTWAPRVAAA